MHALRKLFFLKWCTCNFLIRLKSIAARLRARSLSLFIIRRCLTVAHWARCGCSDFCSFLSQASRRTAVRLFCAEVCGAGELVSENCNHKYSYSHVPVIRVRPLCAICRELNASGPLIGSPLGLTVATYRGQRFQVRCYAVQYQSPGEPTRRDQYRD